jgi:hypothetical protein
MFIFLSNSTSFLSNSTSFSLIFSLSLLFFIKFPCHALPRPALPSPAAPCPAVPSQNLYLQFPLSLQKVPPYMGRAAKHLDED